MGLCVSRSLALLSVSRVRAAGFEMVWSQPTRALRLERGQSEVLRAELRNRDQRAIRFVRLRALSSPCLEVALEPAAGEVPAGGRLVVTANVLARRVGRHGLYGLALELRGKPGYFEVPLTFANAFGLEVVPARTVGSTRRQLRSLASGPLGARRAPRGGHSTEIRELRDHQTGDSLRRVAWKASARRGKLLVRHYESEEQDVVCFVVDASVELWAGRMGHAPLDVAIDAAARRMRQHLAWGHRVGLEVVAGPDSLKECLRVPPGRGPAHERRLVDALVSTPGTLVPARSALGESQVAARVLEHARSLSPAVARGVRSTDLDAIARLAARAMTKAPFSSQRIAAPGPRESLLRSYLAAFGLSSPPRLVQRSESVDAKLAALVVARLGGRQRVALAYVLGPLPATSRALHWSRELSRLPRHRARSLRWLHVPRDVSVPAFADASGRAAHAAARLREDAERRAGERALARFGVAVESCVEETVPRPPAQDEVA